MLKKFFLVVIVSFVMSLAISMIASFLIQTGETNSTTDAKLNVLIDDVAVLISENDEQIKDIRRELDIAYLEKARMFAEMIRLNPGIIHDFDGLCRIRDIMNVDEIHVVDEDGVLRYGSVPGYYGYEMASSPQSGEFIQIINDPSVELVQEPQPNGAGAGWFQYVGVARKDARGFVQVGIQPYRLEEAMQKAAPENILSQIKIDKSSRILLISSDTVAGDSKNKLIGSSVPDIKEGYGRIQLDVPYYYVAEQVGDYLVAALITTADMYSARNTVILMSSLTNAVILLVLVLAIGFWLIRGVIKPLSRVCQRLKTIASGNLECIVEVRNTPEFSSLSDGINTMVSSIGKMLRDAEEMTKTLKDIMSGIEDGTGSVNLSTRELFAESQSLSVSARSQNDAMEEMLRLFGEVHNNAAENTTDASNASEISRTALQNANDGSDKMKEMQIAVKEIDKASQDISKVIKTIDDIAFQTNILALNASVEAARAGTHGKGFAVVAEEVRNLASKSAEAAKHTETLINLSIQRANTGVTIAGETAGKIDEVVDNIRKSASFMERIVKSSQKQAQAVGQLNANMEDIRKGVDVTIRTAERITSESEKLQRTSGEMSGAFDHVVAPEERHSLSDGR